MLLTQSFYLSLTPVICEKLVCGQVDQIMIQIALPWTLVNRTFLDLFRLMMNHKVLCLGLYRAPSDPFVTHGNNKALLPYVYLSPHVSDGCILFDYFTSNCSRLIRYHNPDDCFMLYDAFYGVQGDAVLQQNDRVFVYGTSKDTQSAVAFAAKIPSV